MNGKRSPMPIKTIINMFIEVTPKIFKQNTFGLFVNWICGCLHPMHLSMYSNKGIAEALEKVYGDTSLSDFQSSCIAGKCPSTF